jgi:hypothetical protein
MVFAPIDLRVKDRPSVAANCAQFAAGGDALRQFVSHIIDGFRDRHKVVSGLTALDALFLKIRVYRLIVLGTPQTHQCQRSLKGMQ